MYVYVDKCDLQDMFTCFCFPLTLIYDYHDGLL